MAENPGISNPLRTVTRSTEFDGASGYQELDQVALAFLAPGAGKPRIPDGKTTYSMAKYFPLSANFTITDTDVIVLADMLSDRSRIGIALYYNDTSGTWEVLNHLYVSGDITMFQRARAVCGRMTIQSNTRSTDATVLDGNITTLMVPDWPDTLSFSSLPSYAVSNKLACVNTLLSEGHTVIAKPVYHDFEVKRTGGPVVNAVASGEPDLAVTFSGSTNITFTGSVLTRLGQILVRIHPEHVASGSTFTFFFAGAGPDTVTPVNMQETTINIDGVADQWYTIGEPVGEGQPKGLYGITGELQPSAEGSPSAVINIWFVDPLYSTRAQHLKQITIIQGSTGTKNVQINGTVGFEVIPRPANYPQTQMEPPLGCTWLPLEIFNGLLASDTSEFRLVFHGQDYPRFVRKYLDDRPDSQALISQAVAGVGNASILSTLASGLKKGVRFLKRIGINPGNLLKRGVQYAIDNGYARSPSTAYAGVQPHSFSNLDDGEDEAFSLSPSIVGRATTTNAEEEAAPPQVGFASTKPTTVAGIGDIEDFDPDNDPTNEVIEDVHRFPDFEAEGCVDEPPSASLNAVPIRPEPPEPPHIVHAPGTCYGYGYGYAIASTVGIGDTEDFNPDEEEETPEETRAIEMDPQSPLQVDDIIRSIPFQAAYSGAVLVSNPYLTQFRRYAAFVILGQNDKGEKIAGTTIFEWAVQPRATHTYVRLSEVAVQFKYYEKEEQTPKWTRSVGIDATFIRGVAAEAAQQRALKAFVKDPQFRSLTVPKRFRSEYAIYITMHLPTGIGILSGYSWFGALYALVNSKDPSMVYEIGGQMTTQFGMDAFAVTAVGDEPDKFQHHLASIKDPADAYYGAMKKMDIRPKMVFFFSKDTAAAVYTIVNKDKDYITTDVAIISGSDNKSAYVCFVQAYWNTAMRYFSKDFATFYSAYASVVGTNRLQITDGNRLKVVKNIPGVGTEAVETTFRKIDLDTIRTTMSQQVYWEVLGALAESGVKPEDIGTWIGPVKMSPKAVANETARANALLAEVRKRTGSGRNNIVTKTYEYVNPDDPSKTFKHVVEKKVKGSAPQAARPNVVIAQGANIRDLLAN